MSSTIIMPQLGETVAEGKILAWFKSVGDEIKEGDNLFEVETDKVTMEVQAVVAGRLSEIRVGPGLTAKVGEVVAVIGNGVATAPGLDDASAGEAPQWRPRGFLRNQSSRLMRCGRQATHQLIICSTGYCVRTSARSETLREVMRM